MSTPQDGGPAFPVTELHTDEKGQIQRIAINTGMSLRDWFAGMALQGWLSTYIGDNDQHPTERDEFSERFSRSAYKLADAMLAARKEEA